MAFLRCHSKLNRFRCCNLFVSPDSIQFVLLSVISQSTSSRLQVVIILASSCLKLNLEICIPALGGRCRTTLAAGDFGELRVYMLIRFEGSFVRVSFDTYACGCRGRLAVATDLSKETSVDKPSSSLKLANHVIYIKSSTLLWSSKSYLVAKHQIQTQNHKA